ncbi:MAG: DUF2339 domain-containing protein [Candidatus Acidiferrum sp.]
MESFFLILIPLFLIGTILSFLAFSAVRRLESILKSFPLNELTFRVYQLEQKLAAVQKAMPSSAASSPTAPGPAAAGAPDLHVREPEPAEIPHVSATAPPPAVPVSGSSTPHVSPHPLPQSTLPKSSKEPSSADLETLIGGRWFNRIGIIALLFAVSYFLKLAFDNNWIGPAGRVAIGIILGLLMLPWSDWLLGRGYTYFSEGIAGLGEATLFVSVWAGCQYYALFSRQAGFVALVVVTVIMAYLALRRNSERIAFLSLLGGLLTPALMSSGENQQFVLFSYLLLLGTAALIISWRKGWQILLPLAFGATYLYFWQWYDVFYRRSAFLGSTLVFATLIFLLFGIVPAARALFRHALRALDVLLVLADAFAYIAILYTLLWPHDRWPLTLLFIALAIGHETIALLVPDPNAVEATTPRFLYTGLAVACLTLAIPAGLDHNTVTLALIVEGGVLVWCGFRFLGNLLRPFGYFLLFLAVVQLFAQPPIAGTFLMNERFGTYLLLIAALAVSLWSAITSLPSSRPLADAPASHQEGQPSRIPQSNGSASEAALLTIAINFFALLALSQEFWDFFGSGPRTINHSLAQHLSLSILWTAYAGLLLLLGVQRRSPLLRWQALLLLGVVVIKVFLYDLSFLDRAYRILSFFILGTALLVVSFFYQRKLARDRSAP